MNPKLLLFDIDLTLIRTGGTALRAMEKAFRTFTGFKGEINTLRPDGKTDPAIVRQLFEINGQNFDQNIYRSFMDKYLDTLADDYHEFKDWIIFDGVQNLLEKLSVTDNIFLGLVTGNEERGAKIKLSPFGLDKFFPVGGFASDSEIRAELVPIAIKRAEKHYNQVFNKQDVFIIGDSTGDVKCANANDVNCIAVTTGHTSKEELLKAGKCTIIEDLIDYNKFMELISEGN